jgi:CheY-specific phosphatase CheX
LLLNQETAAIMQKAVECTLRDMFCVHAHCGPFDIGKGLFAAESSFIALAKMNQQDKPYGALVVTIHPGAMNKFLKALNIQHSDDPAVFHDAVSEIANVIYGQIKKSLNAIGFNFEMSLPKILAERDRFFQEHADRERIVVPFLVDGSLCYVAIILNDGQKAMAHATHEKNTG